MAPVGENFLQSPLLLPVPVGVLHSQYFLPATDIDSTKLDQEMLTNVDTWMRSVAFEGENGLISRNDALFHLIYRLGGLDYGMRDRHYNSTTGVTRSDLTMGFNGCALLLAEEKDTDSIDKGVRELKAKFQWIGQFDRLDFVFAIAINRSAFRVLAMTRDRAHVLFHTSILTENQKWSCVVASINIARVLRYNIENELFIGMALPLNRWITRLRGKKIRIGMQTVDVEYEIEDVFERLTRFYRLAFEHNVPHMERIENTNPAIPGKQIFHLVPVGIERRPRDVQELYSALRDILSCITALHNLRYCHCDIRWCNVVYASGEWYVIDCTFATSLDDVPQLIKVSSDIKESYVFNRNIPWSLRHDFYQIGLLLSDWGSPPLFTELCDYLCDRTLVEVGVDRIRDIMESLAAALAEL